MRGAAATMSIISRLIHQYSLSNTNQDKNTDAYYKNQAATLYRREMKAEGRERRGKVRRRGTEFKGTKKKKETQQRQKRVKI